MNVKVGHSITQVYFDNQGKIIGRHRKLQPTHVERTIWGRGDGSDLMVFDTDLGKVGGLICWEHSMDLVRYSLASQGEQIHVGAGWHISPYARSNSVVLMM